MATVSETPLPGLGVRFEFETRGGTRLGVLQHQTGRVDMLVYDPHDPERSRPPRYRGWAATHACRFTTCDRASAPYSHPPG